MIPGGGLGLAGCLEMAYGALDLDTAAGLIERSDLLDAPVAVAPDNLTYVVYESGSASDRPTKASRLPKGNLLEPHLLA